MRTAKRILSYLGILLAAILIVSFLAGIIFSWRINASIKSAAFSYITTGENLTSIVRKGVAQVESRVDNLYAKTSGVESALIKLSGNLQDKGLVLTLLPPETEKELTDSIQEVMDTYNSIRDTIISIKQLYLSISKIPFVNLPMPDDDLIQQTTQVTERLHRSVNELTTRIEEFRTKSAATVDSSLAFVTEINKVIEEINNRLNHLDNQLYATQMGLARLKTNLPPLLNLITVIGDIFLVWLIFANVAVIRWSKQVLTATRITQTTLTPDTEHRTIEAVKSATDAFSQEEILQQKNQGTADKSSGE